MRSHASESSGSDGRTTQRGRSGLPRGEMPIVERRASIWTRVEEKYQGFRQCSRVSLVLPGRPESDQFLQFQMPVRWEFANLRCLKHSMMLSQTARRFHRRSEPKLLYAPVMCWEAMGLVDRLFIDSPLAAETAASCGSGSPVSTPAATTRNRGAIRPREKQPKSLQTKTNMTSRLLIRPFA